MKNVTKIQIRKPAHDVFEAFVDGAHIGNFWFSSSFERWAQDKTITLRYDEYDAQVDIRIVEMEADKQIAFRWGANGEGNLVTIRLEQAGTTTTIVEVTEDGFDEESSDFTSQVLDNKEGWVYMLTCLKAYLEFGVSDLRGALVKG